MAWRTSPVSGHWRIEPGDRDVVVTAIAPVPSAAAYLWQPRVSPKIGLGVPLDRVLSLLDAIAAEVSAGAGVNPWSAAGIDHTEGCAYVQGPAGALEPVTGYRPVPGFVVTRDDLFGLGQRLAVLSGLR